MNKRNLQNSELDLIGRKLIEHGGVPPTAIDKIVSNPELFSLVNARITADGRKPSVTITSSSRFFSFIRRNAIAFGGIVIMVAAAIAAVGLLRSGKDLIAANAVPVPAEIGRAHV